jgi:nucleoside-diphosphate-sugar epimerase
LSAAGLNLFQIFAERAAWDFMAAEKPAFELAVMNPTFVFGPVQRQLRRLDGMNTSNHLIRDLALGRLKAGLPPTRPVFTWVDVRDVAAAHVRALTAAGAGGKRFYTVGGHFSNKRVAEILRARYPDLAGGLPPESEEDDLPEDVYRFDVSRSKEVLGLEYTTLEKSVVDTVESIRRIQG